MSIGLDRKFLDIFMLGFYLSPSRLENAISSRRSLWFVLIFLL